MRLLHTTTLQFETFKGNKIPPYSILSHTWSDDEITYQAYKALLSQNLFTCLLSIYSDRPHEFLEILKADGKLEVPGGLIKILKFCQLARAEHCEWAWVDTCCIDKESSAELSEAINSMFRWYQQAQVCWAHLADVVSDDGSASDETPMYKANPPPVATSPGPPNEQNGEVDGAPKVGPGHSSVPWRPRRAPKGFTESKWFTRGWTLQELLAPTDVKFCDKNWSFIGSKIELSSEISDITGIGVAILGSSAPTQRIAQRSIAERMSWAANRETTRVEDVAYSLLGIFDIHMSLLYGEGEKAFLRLQRKILKTSSDETIFAWDIEGVEEEGDFHGVLASHPRAFRNAGSCFALEMNCDPVTLTSRGASFNVYNHIHLGSKTLRTTLPLNCKRDGEVVGIFLAKLGGVWYRVNEPEMSTHGLHNIGYSSTERFLPPTYTIREPLYVSMSPSPVPTTDHGIGIDQKVDADAFESTINSGHAGTNVNGGILATFVAIRFTTHFIPWPSLVRSVDVSTANKMIEHHPAIRKFQGRRIQSGFVEMTDTGKEVMVGPQSIMPPGLVPSTPPFNSRDQVKPGLASAFGWTAEEHRTGRTVVTEDVHSSLDKSSEEHLAYGYMHPENAKSSFDEYSDVFAVYKKRLPRSADNSSNKSIEESTVDKTKLRPENVDRSLDCPSEEHPISDKKEKKGNSKSKKEKKKQKMQKMRTENADSNLDESNKKHPANKKGVQAAGVDDSHDKLIEESTVNTMDIRQEDVDWQDEEYPSSKTSKLKKKKKKKKKQQQNIRAVNADSNLDVSGKEHLAIKKKTTSANADSSLDWPSEKHLSNKDSKKGKKKNKSKQSMRMEHADSNRNKSIEENSADKKDIHPTNSVDRSSKAPTADTELHEYIAELAGWSIVKTLPDKS